MFFNFLIVFDLINLFNIVNLIYLVKSILIIIIVSQPWVWLIYVAGLSTMITRRLLKKRAVVSM